MASTEPASVNSRFCANVWFGDSRPGTLSMPVTGIAPGPPVTIGIRPPAAQPVLEAWRNSIPPLKAWLPFVHVSVSVKEDNGAVFPRSLATQIGGHPAAALVNELLIT